MGYLTPQEAQNRVKQQQTTPISNYMGSSGTGGMDSGMLDKLLMAGVLSNKISTTDANFIKGIGGTQQEKAFQAKERQAKQSKQQAYDRAKRLATQALEIVQSGKNVSGFSPRYLWEQNMGGGKSKWFQERAALDTLLGQLSGVTAFDEAGKALTATELGIIGGKIPKIGKTESANEQTLLGILADIEAKRNEFLFSQVGL